MLVTALLFNILQRAKFQCWNLGSHSSGAFEKCRATCFARVFALRGFRESANKHSNNTTTDNVKQWDKHKQGTKQWNISV